MTCRAIIECSCTKGCKGKCKCVKEGLCCTTLCRCHGCDQVPALLQCMTFSYNLYVRWLKYWSLTSTTFSHMATTWLVCQPAISIVSYKQVFPTTNSGTKMCLLIHRNMISKYFLITYPKLQLCVVMKQFNYLTVAGIMNQSTLCEPVLEMYVRWVIYPSLTSTTFSYLAYTWLTELPSSNSSSFHTSAITKATRFT